MIAKSAKMYLELTISYKIMNVDNFVQKDTMEMYQSMNVSNATNDVVNVLMLETIHVPLVRRIRPMLRIF